LVMWERMAAPVAGEGVEPGRAMNEFLVPLSTSGTTAVKAVRATSVVSGVWGVRVMAPSMAARVVASSGGMPGGVWVEKVNVLSPLVSTLMLKETRIFVGLPLLLLPTVMMLEKEKVAVDFVVSSALFGLDWLARRGKLQRMASLIVVGVVCTREVMALVRVYWLSRTWSVVVVA